MLAFAVAFTANYTNGLRRWNDLLVEQYSQWFQREVTSDIVVIGIDSRSLSELNSWPWPRRQHARVLDFLHDASAAQVFLDIDFSSQSNAEDDALLAEALARWERNRIVLPLFLQATSGSESSLSLTEPLPAFARSATLASVNLVPDKDSIVRRAESAWVVRNSLHPAVFAQLSGQSATAGAMPIDFSISPGTFSYYSYVDILKGQVPLEDLRGRTVLIGATALELGDMQPVPVHRSLPGVVIHALATQTAISGAVRPASPTATTLALLIGTALLTWLMRNTRWTANLALTAAFVTLAVGFGLVLYMLRIRVDVAPFLCAAIIGFFGITVTSLDAARLRASLLARLASRRKVLFDSVLESSYDGILCVDHNGLIISANAAAQSLLSRSPDRILNQPIATFVPGIESNAESPGLAGMNGRIIESSLCVESTNIPVEISTTAAAHDEGPHYTLILRDLRERKAQEALLRHQATHDSLTGLLNRQTLLEELDRRTQTAAPGTLAVLSLSLSHFRKVNDTLGHTAADAMLCYVAWRLGSVVWKPGALARMDADIFAMVVEFDGEPDQLLELVGSLSESLRRPFEFEGIPIGIGPAFGIARFPLDGQNAVTLVKNAGIAAQHAIASFETCAFYDSDEDRHSVRKLALLGELQTAINTNSLELHYQPKIALRTGRSDSVEALLRWTHPVHGAISPGELIPLVEPTEMLRPLTDWTLRRALEQHRAWAAQGCQVSLAVNLSARLLQDTSFPERLAALLAEQDVLPNILELEITESAMLMDVDRALQVGRRIRELGVTLSIDDYGTGYSSLSYLRDLSVSTLKLDRTFVDDLENNAGNRFIVESTLKLAHALNLVVVAEGVSTQWQVDYLRNLGYDYGQGFHFAKPMGPDACLEWIISQNAPTRVGSPNFPSQENRTQLRA